MKKLVVVAPTYNEGENIKAFLNKILTQKILLKIVITDSHSTDGTAKIVQIFSKKNKNVFYLDVKKRGLGLGLFQGINFATDKLKADFIITMEADLSCNPAQIPGFLEKLKKHDLVIGSRYTSKGRIKNWSWWRRILSRGANLILMFLAFSPNIHEFTNLYRAFTKVAWLKIRPELAKESGWLFVPAFIFVALEKNVTMVEEPIVYFDRFGGRSKMSTVSYGWGLLCYAINYRMRQILKNK